MRLLCGSALASTFLASGLVGAAPADAQIVRIAEPNSVTVTNWGVQVGFDEVSETVDDRGGVVMAGVLAGYVRSDVDFNDDDGEARFSGYNIGGYMTYVTGNFFTDILVKADILDLDYANGGIERDNDNVRSYGARIDTGYRANLGGFFLEPQATLDYVYTEMEDLEVSGATVGMSDGRTLRGRLGLRAGTSFDTGGTRIEASIMPSVWHYLHSESAVAITGAGETVRIDDPRNKTYGEVSGIVNVFGASDRTSAFLKADYRFGDDLKGYGLRAGLRFQF
ncbi:autotransporter outer membrane beta-barrel domain-containing protein [Allosphingosinicella flava]|uniref:Autotransporter outer membrane beta-barrel domain-containing protein n=1 Tax=Allosphingosinicella flava TaxID=2771430 RepID=A0A7T2GJU3_9SPHN|nr:autotransporter outer membrane beta-barrel domain-containing protein [Sphingosinicella flava]QPQ55161.1 autotransporter outer membrane beta-barrel domain-containing protein [Sphingosinicella flava]